MGDNNFFKNVARVMFGNAALLLSQVLTGFILPKLMSVESFGNYRIFMLYGAYVGLLHFGFVDGILFKYGGKNIDDLKCQFKLEKKLSLILCDMFHKYLIRCPIV